MSDETKKPSSEPIQKIGFRKNGQTRQIAVYISGVDVTEDVIGTPTVTTLPPKESK